METNVMRNIELGKLQKMFPGKSYVQLEKIRRDRREAQASANIIWAEIQRDKAKRIKAREDRRAANGVYVLGQHKLESFWDLDCKTLASSKLSGALGGKLSRIARS